ncbi:Hypothetical predicted protein [Paramuricea clavata]|uniref:Uncharacterized protein n=1 Tax=Paramuricea clavata TaxID=317549 RepID=A0A6S7HBZ8_PARCT|nr:Hypothetical predicted protein [Paramuricea clavata]
MLERLPIGEWSRQVKSKREILVQSNQSIQNIQSEIDNVGHTYEKLKDDKAILESNVKHTFLLENEKVHMPKGRSADAIPTKLDENNSDKVIGISHNLARKRRKLTYAAVQNIHATAKDTNEEAKTATICGIWHTLVTSVPSKDITELCKKSSTFGKNVIPTIVKSAVTSFEKSPKNLIRSKFVECDLKLDGKWSSPGGCSKKFTCYNLDISITWYPKKLNTLVFHGEESSGLVDALINMCAEAISEDDGLSNNVCVSAIHSSIATINPAVDEPEQMSNHCIKDFELTDNHQKVSIEHDFKLGCQCRILAADLEGVKLDIAIMCRDIETKFLAAYNSRDSDSEQISELKHELLKEKEKCKKFNGVLSAEQSLSNQPEQINTYNCIIDTVKSIETANSNLGICLPGEPFIPETVSVESPLDNSCLIVQPASCNRTNNKLDNKCEINKVKLTEHNMNNDKISKAKVSRSYSRRNLNSPPYCESLSLKSLGNLPLIEISKPFITQKKESFLENP